MTTILVTSRGSISFLFTLPGRLRADGLKGTCTYYSIYKKGKVKVVISQLCPTVCNLWTVAHQAPMSMGFSRQESWSVLPCPLPGDPPNPGIKGASLRSSALADRFCTTSTTWEAHIQE